jgi:hypothetical protein
MHLRLAALALALTAAPVLAEETSATPAPSPGKVGLGVTLGTDMEGSFRVPILIGGSLLLEPELGARNVATSFDGNVAHLLKIGIGLVWMAPVFEQVRASVGGRLEAFLETNSSHGSGSNGVRGAAVVGAEWLVTPRVSLGLEVQAGYFYTEEQSAFGPGTGFDTAGLVVARIFPW